MVLSVFNAEVGKEEYCGVTASAISWVVAEIRVLILHLEPYGTDHYTINMERQNSGKARE